MFSPCYCGKGFCLGIILLVLVPLGARGWSEVFDCGINWSYYIICENTYYNTNTTE